VQQELDYLPGIALSSNYKILVVECISKDDPVGRVSRKAWETVKELFAEENSPISFDIREVQDVKELRATIATESPEVLVISAHGARMANLTGLVVGKDFTYGEGLGPLPPVVILSACQVSPRGMGELSIADLLLREGALAVLGTQVPVDVYHNSLFMGRFFTYLAESAARKSDHHLTLLDLWQHVQGSNAVNDVISGSQSLQRWGRSSAPGGLPVIQEFMLNRANGELRRGHVYRDTEEVLGRIADDQGVGTRVRNWFRSPGYVPESLFYVMIGRPERIFLRRI
jgi:hypothetical protein